MGLKKLDKNHDYYCNTHQISFPKEELELHEQGCDVIPVNKVNKPVGLDPDDIVNQLMHTTHFVTLRDTDETLHYKSGYWQYHGETVIREIVELNVDRVGSFLVNEVVKKIKRQTYIDRDRFTPPPNHINVRNGIINVPKMKFMPHDRHYYFRWQLPVTYDPAARCPKILAFLRQCLDPRDIVTFIEEMASCLIELKLERAYIHVGAGANGKSTAFRILQALLGGHTYSAISIHDLLLNRFSRAQLDGKLANIFPDIDSKEMKQTHNLKILVSGDYIEVEKKMMPHFMMSSRARLFFSANQLPEMDENTDAIFRRFIITEWSQQFLGSKSNPKLIYELTTDEELSGLLNILLGTAQKLIRNNKFTYTASVDQMRAEWHVRSDYTEQFVQTCIRHDANGDITKDRILQLYTKFCEIAKINADGDRTFFNRVKKFIPTNTEVTRRNGKPIRVIRGISENMEWSNRYDFVKNTSGPTVAQIQTFTSESYKATELHSEHTLRADNNISSSDHCSSVAGVTPPKEPIVPTNLIEEVSKRENEIADKQPTYHTMRMKIDDMVYTKDRNDNTWAFVCYDCNPKGAGPFQVVEAGMWRSHKNHPNVRFLTFDQFIEERVKPRYELSK